MKRRLFKTMVAVLAIAAAAAGPVRGQQQTYTVTFTGFSYEHMNTTVSDATMPYEINEIDDSYIALFNVTSNMEGEIITSLSVTGGDGKVSVSQDGGPFMILTITGAFEGTAQVHCEGTYNDPNFFDPQPVSGDFYVTCVANVAPSPHTVRMAAGTEDAANWSIASGDAQVPGTQVLENVMSGSQVTATYNGTTKKVKSVKAVKYVAPAATVTTAPTATATIIEAGSTTALVNAGAANGGTMMYAVTTTDVQPASTADFSASIPTAEGRAAGTYYVWFYAKADADHSDSEIGSVSVTVAVMTTVTWNSTNVFNSDHQNDEIRAWQSGSLTYEGITISKSGEYLSSFRAYDGVEQKGSLTCYGEPGDDDSFTFTAPDGKKFCKIEIIDNVGISFDEYGDWTEDATDPKIVWSGTAASTVTLGTVYTAALDLNSIVFKLIDAQ